VWYRRLQRFLASHGDAIDGAPVSSDRRSIQPFDSILATVRLPDGCNFSIGCPWLGAHALQGISLD
jgi:hypothetical protein